MPFAGNNEYYDYDDTRLGPKKTTFSSCYESEYSQTVAESRTP